MGRQIRPARVYQNTLKYISSSIIAGKTHTPPAWFKALEAIPPTEIETREYAVQHSKPDAHQRRPRHLYRPKLIVYPEDELRKTFFKDHPWELARPRMILETDGKDARRMDWSKGVRQPDTPLTGECVVQRQLWLMEHEGLSKDQAYDKARREFYRLRLAEEVERRIAQEEARMVGAYFGKNTLQIGMDLEDKSHEKWKKYARDMMIKEEAVRNDAYQSFGEEDSTSEALEADTTA